MLKPYIYAPIPEFDQMTQYVTQIAPVDMGGHYFVGIAVRGIQDNGDGGEMEQEV